MYRLAPQRPSHGVVAPYTGGEILFSKDLTRRAVSDRYAREHDRFGPAVADAELGLVGIIRAG